MKNVFESLENLNVSEKCYNDIMNIVEEIINEVSKDTVEKAKAKLASKQVRASLNKLEYNGNDSKEIEKLEKEQEEANKKNDRFEATKRKWEFSKKLKGDKEDKQ